jgi:hypothetical protein
VYFSLKYRVEINKDSDEVFNFFQYNKELIEREIKKSSFLKLAGFRVTLNKGKKQVKICRLNPFWDYIILKIMSIQGGCIVEIHSHIQPLYDYILLVLFTVLFLMLVFSLNEILLPLLFFSGFFSIFVVNLKTKYNSFHILQKFCQRNF